MKSSPLLVLFFRFASAVIWSPDARWDTLTSISSSQPMVYFFFFIYYFRFFTETEIAFLSVIHFLSLYCIVLIRFDTCYPFSLLPYWISSPYLVNVRYNHVQRYVPAEETSECIQVGLDTMTHPDIPFSCSLTRFACFPPEGHHVSLLFRC